MNVKSVNVPILNQAFALLPAGCDSVEARVMLLTIGLQESKFESRRQLIKKNGKLVPEGPAAGFWQFEEGNEKSSAGVWGVMNHFSVGKHAKAVCRALGIAFDAKTIWRALETNDVLAACFARLLLMSDPHKLPKLDDVEGAKQLYLRTWRPGKPHVELWAGYHAQAINVVVG